MPEQSIIEKQNTEESLQLLSAASQFYGLGKRALAFQIGLTVGLTIAVSIATSFYPNFKIWAAFTGITVAWIDVLFIDRIQIYFRKRGALVQEQLDCSLFDLPWNELRCGKQIEPEEIHRAAIRFRRHNGDEKLRDWYPTAVGSLPKAYGTLICQRSCLWWDTDQRRVYANYLVAAVAVVLLILVTLSLIRSQSVHDLILATYTPIAPAIIWCFREARRQKEAADGLERARNFVDGVWKSVVKGVLSNTKLQTALRQIQDALFEGRSKNPLIFNWIYKRLRTERESAMAVAADKLAAEIRSQKLDP